jgi:hypothetical protein
VKYAENWNSVKNAVVYTPKSIKKMCRVSARRLSIYNFAWELLKATNLQAESKILKYWNIKSTNQNENFSKKSMFGTLKV